MRVHSRVPAEAPFHASRQQRAEVELFIDGRPVKVEEGSAVIQACEAAGVEIPRFCYHGRLAVAGNCRMCLVELEKSPKPIASCAMPVMPGMKIKTNTPLVKKAREGVMEFLLANHPLDCPICDQGGECDLQDQSMRYGSDRSRFSEPGGKRATENKNLGPLVKTIMTRCIHCTRCVRFANEVAGAVEMGTSGRGNDMQIGTYVEKTLATEMSGNIIDLCPVGALTSKPYSFAARAWELKRTETIDVFDAVGSNIRVDSRGVEVMRVLPRLNDDINEEWLADKSRFACDGLKRQRLTTPLVRKGNEFVPATWPEALQRIAAAMDGVSGNEMVAIAGQFADAESLVALKDLFNQHDSEHLQLESSAADLAGVTDVRANYVLNSTINGIEAADAILLVGTNPRHEAPILNTRIRKAYLHNGLDVGVLGQAPNLNYEFAHVGTSVSQIDSLLTDSSVFAKKLRDAKRPLVVVGSGVLDRPDAVAALAKVSKFVESLKPEAGWNAFNVLHRSASNVAALDIGYDAVPRPKTDAKFVYLLGADNVAHERIPKDAFVVYQGHHGDTGAYYADVILPGAAYTEKAATYVNTEGRTQVTRAAVTAPAAAREDWTIIRALSEIGGKPLAYDDIHELRARLAQIAPNLVHYDVVSETSPEIAALGRAHITASKAQVSSQPLDLPIKDYYLTDAISRSSATMAKCSQVFTHGKPDLEAAQASC
ncbi:ndufs1 NADH-ubiquinone oxidoreductase subunit [Polyrhizophydium stewartii]|uniref:Ndufs1 NADH-ubiquinone oxidoreductase subunit n=1 Tax=Polyrhizophydium stewartii TaxID=2732419 RepID=A0ABR4N1L3_9FUNG